MACFFDYYLMQNPSDGTFFRLSEHLWCTFVPITRKTKEVILFKVAVEQRKKKIRIKKKKTNSQWLIDDHYAHAESIHGHFFSAYCCHTIANAQC